MSAAERADEVAALLARGLSRVVMARRASVAGTRRIPPDQVETGLDLPPGMRLSVAQRPAG
jgi:hypothetical protein